MAGSYPREPTTNTSPATVRHRTQRTLESTLNHGLSPIVGRMLSPPDQGQCIDMPIESPESRRWLATLTRRVPADADAEQIADAVVVIWLEINQALHPIIGFRGVAALYNRSLRITTREYPWLGDGHQGVLAAVDASALKATLLRQPPDVAAAGGMALFVTFHELLASLVGPSLTDQLLRAVWTQPSGASPEQDFSS